MSSQFEKRRSTATGILALAKSMTLQLVLAKAHSPKRLSQALKLDPLDDECALWNFEIEFLQSPEAEQTYSALDRFSRMEAFLERDRRSRADRIAIRPTFAMNEPAINLMATALMVLGIPHHWALKELDAEDNSSRIYSQQVLLDQKATLADLARDLSDGTDGEVCRLAAICVSTPGLTRTCISPAWTSLQIDKGGPIDSSSRPSTPAPDDRDLCIFSGDTRPNGAHLFDHAFGNDAFRRTLAALATVFDDSGSGMQPYFAAVQVLLDVISETRRSR